MNLQTQLLESITRAQSRFIAEEDANVLYDGLLQDLLELTASDYGFVAETAPEDDGRSCVRTRAIRNAAWDAATRRFFEAKVERRFELRDPDTIHGTVLRSGKPVICNDPENHPRAGSLPPGLGALNNFMGLPLHGRRRLTGMVGVANRPGGYDDRLAELLQPYLATCANIMEAHHAGGQRRKVENELRTAGERTRAILENIVEGIITTDETGRMEAVNRSAERIFGYRADELIGRNIRMLMPSPEGDAASDTQRRSRAGGEAGVIGGGREVAGRRKDGAVFPLELSVSEIRLAGNRIFTRVVRDITERKEVDRLKSDFVSVVSHELRTPLTSIRGSLGLMEGGVFGELPSKALEVLQIARTNSDRLIRLINDILDLEKIESKKIDLRIETLDAWELVRTTLREMHGMAAESGIELRPHLEPVPEIRGDRDRLVQVLKNLLSNAIKHSPPESRVDIRVSPRGGGRVRISVADSGPGIHPDLLPRVFDKFYQIDSSDSRARGGTGLGLPIARGIVEQHGGEIGGSSEPGKGSLFYFDLPAARPAAAEPATDRGERPRVLVVEDDGLVAKFLADFLSDEGYEPLCAGSISQAERLLAGSPPAAALVDAALPDGSGLELVGRLAGMGGAQKTPVIVVSGWSGDDGTDPGLLAFDRILKPFDDRELARTIRTVLRREDRVTVLVVDDDPAIREMALTLLDGEGLRCLSASSGTEAVAIARETRPDMIILREGFILAVRELLGVLLPVPEPQRT